MVLAQQLVRDEMSAKMRKVVSGNTAIKVAGENGFGNGEYKSDKI